MNETLTPSLDSQDLASTSQERHRKSMDAKAAAKEARLKAALRSNLKRRKEGASGVDTTTD